MLLYYITDRKTFAGSESQQRVAVLQRIAAAARAEVDYIQLREKDLSSRDLERLARDAVHAVRENSSATKLLINGRADVALACGADGVHLPAGETCATEIRALWMQCSDREPLIGISAHSAKGMREAESLAASFAVVAPIFEKMGTEAKGIGLEALRVACAGPQVATSAEAPHQPGIAVLALGGVTLANARSCLEAGAAGVAGIRLFQTGDIVESVGRLRALADTWR